MWVKTPVKVAGFERGVRPMGAWSMSITLSTWAEPVDAVEVGLRAARAPCSRCLSTGSRVSTTRLDLPEPGDAGHAGEHAERETTG